MDCVDFWTLLLLCTLLFQYSSSYYYVTIMDVCYQVMVNKDYHYHVCQFGEQSEQFLNCQVGSSLPCDCQIVT